MYKPSDETIRARRYVEALERAIEARGGDAGPGLLSELEAARVKLERLEGNERRVYNPYNTAALR